MSATSFNARLGVQLSLSFLMSDFLAPADLRPRSGADSRLLRASERLFSLPPVTVPRERGTLFGKVSVNSLGSWRERRPGEASFGGISWTLEPALLPGRWAPAGLGMHLPCRGRDERGQRCCRRGASGRARCPGRELTPGDSPLKPRETLPWLRSRFNSRRLQTRGRGPGSGSGGNGGRSPGRWPGQRRAFPGMTPLRGL